MNEEGANHSSDTNYKFNGLRCLQFRVTAYLDLKTYVNI